MHTKTPSDKLKAFGKQLCRCLIVPLARTVWIAVLATAGVASGQGIPSLMNYQGKLLDLAGNPMPTGSYDVVFSIWKKANPADPADALVWGQTNTVTIANGIFNVVLGDASRLISSALKTNLVDAFDEPQRYLSLTIVRNPPGPVASPTEILPRQQMLSAPYALKTAVAIDAVNAYNGVPPGSILPFGGANVPIGFLLCDGTAVSRSAYSKLFTAIGTAWGEGDGFSSFNLPDLRGMFLRGVDGSRGIDMDKDTRTRPNSGGNSGNNVGSTQPDEFKGHSHTYRRTYRIDPGNSGSGGTPLFTTDREELTGQTGGSETRPKNVYVNHIIKY